MKRFYLVCFLLLISLPKLFSQEQVISGVITDSLLTPIAWANVIANPSAQNGEMKFAVSDEKGRFRLSLKKNENYAIAVKCLGYSAYTFEYKPTTKKQNFNIVLKQSNELLNEVVVMDQPVVAKEDTITYHVTAYTTGEERKLKEVLKKLPGVEVKKNGEVTVQGKKVNKMLVEGKKFFGGGTKLAVENIPADAVNQVEVLKNYSETSFMKGLSGEGQTAMNIKLKKDKKNFVFGDVEAGKGNHEYYRGNANLFYYSPQRTFGLIGDANNSGKSSFSPEDHVAFEGGIDNIMRHYNSFSSIQESNLYSFLIPTNSMELDNYFCGINTSMPISHKLKMSGYAIYSGKKINTLHENNNQYYFDGYNYSEQINSAKETIHNSGLGQLIFDYTPSLSERIEFITKINLKEDHTDNSTVNSIENLMYNFTTLEKPRVFNLNQSVNWEKKFSKKFSSSLLFNYRFYNNKAINNWETNKAIFINLIDLAPDPVYDISQINDKQYHQLGLINKQYFILSNLSHLIVTIGNHFKYSTLSSNNFQTYNESQINDFSDFGFNNSLRYKLNDLFLGFHLKFKKKISTVKAGAHGHYVREEIAQETDKIKNNFYILPDFKIKLSFSDVENLSFRYSIKKNLPDEKNYLNRYLIESYNSVFLGNP